MHLPMDMRCLQCGRPDEGTSLQCLCGASLLVDVVLTGGPLGERKCFQVARALGELGPPVPPYSTLRRDLERAEGRVVRAVSQPFARQVLEVLAVQGTPAELRPSRDSKAKRGWVPLVLGGAVLVMLGMGVVVSGRTSPGSAALLTAIGLPAREQARTPPPATDSRGPGQELTTQEISRRSLPSTVNLRCEGATGAGFFVGDERVLTNAHVACPVGAMMDVTLSDGRKVLGQTLERDEDLDLATVRVSGARAEPLALGDAADLTPGDRLVFIGSPKGMAFTVHEGKVSHVGREYLGVGYVQFDASVNPGNSGGPLLNGRGEVVGVVSLKVTNAEGIGLALPIQYAKKLVSVPSTPESTRRWTALLEKVAREEERELQQFRLEPYRPALLGLQEEDSLGMVVALVERFPQPPSQMRHSFSIQSDAGTCMMEVNFERWKPLMGDAKGEDGESSRRLKWLVSKKLTENLYVAAARLPVESCSVKGTGSAWLSVDRGSPEVSRTKVDLGQVEKARQLWKERSARQAAPQGGGWASPSGSQGSSTNTWQVKQYWSEEFQRAQSIITQLEDARRKYAQQDALGVDMGNRLKEIDRQLKRARDHLDDLERQASAESVPREWRR